MKNNVAILMIGLIALSILSSFLFIWYGMNMIMSKGLPESSRIFAYVTTSYGLANIAVLSIAWSSREAWACLAGKLIGLSYFGVIIIDRINTGLKGGLELIAILVLGLVLGANWLAVKKVVARE